MSAVDRAKWAGHLHRFPPVGVAIGIAARALLLALGVKQKDADAAIWFAKVPGIGGNPDAEDSPKVHTSKADSPMMQSILNPGG